jgi:flagellar motor switch protein FliN/FliY
VTSFELSDGNPPVAGPDLRACAGFEALLDVTMPVVIEIGRTHLTVQDVLQLAPGSVVTLDRAVGEPVDLYVSDRRFAQGEVVVVDDHFAVRVTKLLAGNTSEAA